MTVLRWLMVAIPTMVLALLVFELDPLDQGKALALGIAWAGGSWYGEWSTE